MFSTRRFFKWAREESVCRSTGAVQKLSGYRPDLELRETVRDPRVFPETGCPTSPDPLYPSPGPISILRILFASHDRYVASRHCFPQRWDRTTHESIKKIGVSSATDIIPSNILGKRVTISTFLSARLGPCRV